MRVELLHWAESVLKYLVQFGIILLEGTGAVILLFSGAKSVVRLCKNQPHARLSMAQGIALALCFKLGGEVLRTVIVREWSELLVLGAIIFLHAAMSILIHWEIKMEEKRLSAMNDLTDRYIKLKKLRGYKNHEAFLQPYFCDAQKQAFVRTCS